MSPERFRSTWGRPKASGSVSGASGSVRERVGASGNAWERLGAVGGVSERPGEPLGGLKTSICTPRRGSQRPQAARRGRESPLEGLEKKNIFTPWRSSQGPQATRRGRESPRKARKKAFHAWEIHPEASGSPERQGEPHEGLKRSIFTSRRSSQRPQAAQESLWRA